MADAVLDHVAGASRASLHAPVGEQPVELGEREAIEPLDKGVAGRRDVLGQLGPRLIGGHRLAAAALARRLRRRTLATLGRAAVAPLAGPRFADIPLAQAIHVRPVAERGLLLVAQPRRGGAYDRRTS